MIVSAGSAGLLAAVRRACWSARQASRASAGSLHDDLAAVRGRQGVELGLVVLAVVVLPQLRDARPHLYTALMASTARSASSSYGSSSPAPRAG